MTVQYLIDSENVGDFWIPLLDLPAEETQLIVFYTRNSPHMSYDSLIRLKESDRTVTFIKCYEGTNALDFQLVSELGYRISQNEDGSFVIVTNDTGFDAAVKYWRRRKKSVKRITGKECRNLERRQREDLGTGRTAGNHAAQHRSEHPYPVEDRDDGQDAPAETWTSVQAPDQDVRPSRPNLRDAESAAQPEPEEEFPAEELYMQEADAEMAEYDPEEDAFGTDPEDVFDADSEEDFDPEAEFSPEMTDTDAYDAYDGDLAEPDSEEDGQEGDTRGGIDLEEDPDAVFAQGPAEDFDASLKGFDPRPAAEEEPLTDLAQSEEENPADPAFGSIFPAEDAANAADSACEGQASLIVSPDGEVSAALDPHLQSEDLQTEDLQTEYLQMEASEEADDLQSARETGAEMPPAPSPVSVEEREEESSDGDTAADAEEEEHEAETAPRSRSRRSRSRRSRSGSRKQEQAAAAEESPADAEKETGAAQAAEENAGSDTPPGDEEIARIVACIGPDNLAELHNQLATFYGEHGKDIYLSIKNNSRKIPVLKPDLPQKFAYYCEIIFARSGAADEYPSDMSEYLLNVREKLNNLNSLRYALQKHYGKEKGRRYYFLLKPFAKTMYQM